MQPESCERPRASFIGITYAGWETRLRNLELNVRTDGRLQARFDAVTGWEEGGVIESLPIPRSLRGRSRAILQARGFGAIRQPDVVWTSAHTLMGPYMWRRLGSSPAPVVAELDWTVEQREDFAELYFGRPGLTGSKLRHAMDVERRRFRRIALFTPMSDWAAEGLRRQGVAEDRIVVSHPGLRLDDWPLTRRVAAQNRPLRVLFVGGDFVRKGGDLLIRLVMGPLSGRVHLDIVTRDKVATTAGVEVHSCEPNSPELRSFYSNADLFVMPTRADCFGHATVEAMASGLPVIVGDVGAASEIVDQGRNGWRVAPEGSSLLKAMEMALASTDRLLKMGQASRQIAEERFDGVRNDTRLIEMLLELAKKTHRNSH